MSIKATNVLFLGTGNTVRSIIAEAILNRDGDNRFRAFSAGSQPAGVIDPGVLALLKKLNHPVSGLHSKHWQDFAGDDAPVMDFVFTVCDGAAAETPPRWPGQPLTAHWGVPELIAQRGTEAERAVLIADTYRMLSNRIGVFVALPMTGLDRLCLEQRLRDIGRGRTVDRAQA